MVVHEAGNILRSTHDANEIAKGLLDVIAEAVFAGSGCVASFDGDELKILAIRGLEDYEADALAADAGEAGVWFEVAEGVGTRKAGELAETLGLRSEETEDDEEDQGFDETEDDAGTATDELDQSEVEGSDGTGEEDLDSSGDEEIGGREGEDRYELKEDGGEGQVGYETDKECDSEEPAGGELEEDDGEGQEEDETDEGEVSSAPAFDFYVPLRVEENTLGVLALGRRVDGVPFSEEDERIADSLCSHLALALDHASLFAERNLRIEQLSVLLQISREITSTLDLEKVLATIAHMVGMVLPNRRTVLALTAGAGIAIRASTDPLFKSKSATKDPLIPILRWAHGTRQVINTCRENLDADPDAEGRGLLLPWLSEEGGPRGICSIPLEDDQGVLGLLAIETDSDAAPLDDQNEELITILANQTTVAIRNAELYQRVPMISVLQPVLSRTRRITSDRRKLLTRLGAVGVILALGLLIPLPSWISGEAEVRPATPVPVRTETQGTVEEVLVGEGQEVAGGTLLARMRRDELEMELEQVRSAALGARAEAASARATGDLATFRARQAALNDLFERESFLLTKLDRTEIVAPTGGVILTRDIELRLGERLARGEVFLDLADLSTMEVDVAVHEKDVDRVTAGRGARVKVHAYPDRTFRGQIARIAPRAGPDGTFRVIVSLPNEDGALRPGMTGRAHLDTPNQPVLRTVLRPVLRGIRFKFWF
jgi:RND family efflux transporter MFP subunit